MHPDQLSPVAQDYLKVIWTRTEWGADPMTTGDLAEHFGTSAANVTETLKRVDAQGLVERVPYKPVALTEVGLRCAVAMVRRHRLLETYLVEKLGYGWHEVHDEAERLEHAVSDDFVTRIDEALGHPTADPHGDPIPDAGHRSSHPEDALTLAAVQAAGAYRVLRVSDADPAVLQRARELGVVPGAELEIELGGGPDGTRAVRAPGGAPLEVGAELAAATLVVPSGPTA